MKKRIYQQADPKAGPASEQARVDGHDLSSPRLARRTRRHGKQVHQTAGQAPAHDGLRKQHPPQVKPKRQAQESIVFAKRSWLHFRSRDSVSTGDQPDQRIRTHQRTRLFSVWAPPLRTTKCATKHHCRHGAAAGSARLVRRGTLDAHAGELRLGQRTATCCRLNLPRRTNGGPMRKGISSRLDGETGFAGAQARVNVRRRHRHQRHS